MRQKYAYVFLITFFICLTIPENLSGIPAFARKYKTSCVTCHVVYPKLTPFGEAYRLNGFQMPEGDEDQIKEEPVRMGADSYKRVWPESVWPGSIPGTSPVSFRVRSGLTWQDDETGQYAEFTPPAIQLITGGTFGEEISFFAGAHLFEHGEAGSIDRLYLRFNDLFSSKIPYNLLNVRIGQFVPDIVTYITNHRSLTHTAYAFNTYAPGLSEFSGGHLHGAPVFGLENFQLGAEASGLVGSRFRYVVGLINGNGTATDNNAAKDVYGKLAYKLGGLAFDGSSDGDIYGPKAENWSEKSSTVSIFVYTGKGTNTGDASGEDDHTHKILASANSLSSEQSNTDDDFDIIRVGSDINIFLRDLNVFGGFIAGSDGHDRYSLVFTEANYMLFPWLIGILRYEQANPENEVSIKRLVTHISALYTANVRFSIESRFDPADLTFSNLVIGLDYAF